MKRKISKRKIINRFFKLLRSHKVAYKFVVNYYLGNSYTGDTFNSYLKDQVRDNCGSSIVLRAFIWSEDEFNIWKKVDFEWEDILRKEFDINPYYERSKITNYEIF